MKPCKYPYSGRRKKQETPSPIFSARPIFNQVPIVEEVKVELEVEAVEKIIYKESPTARLPNYHNNNNDGKIIKWVKSKKYMGGKVWSKRT